MSRRARCWMLVAAVAVLLGWPSAAVAEEGAATAEVVARVQADGSVAVTQTLTFDAPRDEITQVLALHRDIDSSAYHRYRVSGIAATVDGQKADLATATSAGRIEIRIGVGGTGPVTLTYEVDGATRPEQGQEGALTLMEWPLIQGLPVALTRVEGSVELGLWSVALFARHQTFLLSFGFRTPGVLAPNLLRRDA